MRRLIVLTGLAIFGLVFFGVTLGWQVALLLALFLAFIGSLVALVGAADRLLGRWSWYENKRRQRTLDYLALEVERRAASAHPRVEGGAAGWAVGGVGAAGAVDGGGGGGGE